MSEQFRRDITIDIVRGIAIFTMLCANLGPWVADPHSGIYRLYSSFAAPIFITVAGMMVAYRVMRAGEKVNPPEMLRYFLIRGGFLIGVGALIDIVAWQILPFTTVDVLYLIGVGLPLTCLALRLPLPGFIALIAVILLVTPLLQQWLGYSAYPSEYNFSLSLTNEVENQASILHHWLIDGWFPLFPWLAYMLVGALLAYWRWHGLKVARSFYRRPIVIGLGVMLAVGVLLMILFPGPLYNREGYSELFYPATPGFMLVSFAVIGGVFCLADATRNWPKWQYIRVLGEASLFMYVLHSLVIGWLISNVFEEMGVVTLLWNYLVLTALLVGCGFLLRRFKAHNTDLPVWTKWLIGE